MMTPWKRKRLERERAEATAKHNEQTWFFPALNMCQDVIKVEPPQQSQIAATLISAASAPKVQSTNASQWSTADAFPKKLRQPWGNPIEFRRTSKDDPLRGIYISVSGLKERYAYYKWLINNPHLIVALIRRAHQQKLRWEDSALFM